MIRAFVYGLLLMSLQAACFGVATADERVDVPVALDFTPLGQTAVSGTHAAPADVNFGTYPLSVLGIENVIRHADARVDAYAHGAERWNVGPIAYTVVAIRDWERRYPGDPWIAKDLLSLYRFYAHVGTAESRDVAARAMTWLEHDYPNSEYARAAVAADSH